MAAKSKKRSRKTPLSTLFQQVRRNLEKGDFKQAIKGARVCYRQAPSEEHRRFLECAHIGRAQQLHPQGNREACRSVVESLLELGVTEPSVEVALPDLLASLGMLDRLPQGITLSDDQQAQLQIKAADQAVLRPRETPGSMAEIRHGAECVREALELLYQDDEAAALARLTDIGRRSPLADWRFFVRGLAAYYRQDSQQMLANWERLDQDRCAARIARPLAVMAGAAPHDPTNTALRTAVAKLERGLTSQSLLSQLGVLQRQLSEKQWNKGLRTLRSVGGSLKKLDVSLYKRLTRWLCSRFVGDGLISELERLARVVDPLPLDPHWNRARAVALEMSEDCHLSEPILSWQKYVGDLDQVSELSPTERDIARALVWRRMAGLLMEKAESLRHCYCGEPHDDEVEEAMELARVCFEKCLELVPTLARAYQQFAEMYEEADELERAAEVYRRALEHLPDDFDALLFLVQHHLNTDEPVQAQVYAQRARSLKPLDKNVTTMLWATHVSAARQFARKGDFEQGRLQFAAADELFPDRGDDYDVLGRKAIFEIKSGSAETSRQLVERAQEKLEEPTALWLLMTAEAKRYELPKEEAWFYEKRWIDALKRRSRGTTAGLMSKFLYSHLKTQEEYRGRPDHLRRLVAYVRRCSRVKWRETDLYDVCELLREAVEGDLLDKYARKGQKKFPESAYFHWLVGHVEIERGPSGCNLAIARRSIERALELSRSSSTPRDQAIFQAAKRQMTFLEEIEQQSLSGYFVDDDEDEFEDAYEDSPGSGFSPSEMFGMFAEMCGRLGIDPEEFLRNAEAEEEGPNPPTRPSRQQRKKRRKS